MQRVALFLVGSFLALTACAQNAQDNPRAKSAPPPADPAPTAQPAPPPPPPAAQPAPTPPVPGQPGDEPNGPAYDTGALTIEVSALREVRTAYLENPARSAAESNLAMLIRIRGEKIKTVTRHGQIHLTELVDDTGRSLLDPNAPPPDETLRPMTLSTDMLRQEGIRVSPAPARPAAREAKMIKRIRGRVHLVAADKLERITIVNPAQYIGKTIDDPRLKELKIEIAVVSLDDVENPPPVQALALHIKSNPDNVQSVNFYDAWMRTLRARERPARTAAGETIALHMIDGPGFNSEMQMVLNVHPNVEQIDLQLDQENVPLP